MAVNRVEAPKPRDCTTTAAFKQRVEGVNVVVELGSVEVNFDFSKVCDGETIEEVIELNVVTFISVKALEGGVATNSVGLPPTDIVQAPTRPD